MMSDYLLVNKSAVRPRLPLEGSLDLTYRCNNTCRHCWLWLPENASERRDELSFDEIRRIADEARALGCRKWNISGGEPMLRADFPEIFDYLTSRAVSYSLNTNGTLITPAIAQLLKRKGKKMVALYGATPEVYDHVTRHVGGFELAMHGFARLKEAGADFIVQLIPMRANWHQWDAMIALAKTLSPLWRVGAPWLYLSACSSPVRNSEILAQRLDPRDVVNLDPPAFDVMDNDSDKPCAAARNGDDRLYAACIATRRNFHIDPYGQMTFCSFIKDSALRFDLRRGCVREAWEDFIPSLADKVRGGREYLENCGSCDHRAHCDWCGVYSQLEHGRLSAPVPHLCEIARKGERYKEAWRQTHRRYYQIAGVTITVESDLPFTDFTFDPKFSSFQADGPGNDNITIRHHFSLPDRNGSGRERLVCRKGEWVVSRKDDTWLYQNVAPEDVATPGSFAVVSGDHSRATIYHSDSEKFAQGGLRSLSLLRTDQMLLAPFLAERDACFMHASGVSLRGQGLLLVAHSGGGKSTLTGLLRDRVHILCDDRMIVRRWPGGFKIHGTWCTTAEPPKVSSASAPLRAIFFLRKSAENRISRLVDLRLAFGKLLACLIQPLVTPEWWRKVAPLIEAIAREIPCYELQFDKSGAAVPLFEEFASSQAARVGASTECRPGPLAGTGLSQ